MNLYVLILLLIILIILKRKREGFEGNNKIAIVMMYTDNIKDYAGIAEQVNRKYAKKNGYDFIVEKKIAKERAPTWYKLKIFEKYLSQYDWLFWIDADAIFTNHTKRLEEFIQESNGEDILICDDKPNAGGKPLGLANCGTFFMKNTPWSNTFLKTWWDKGSGKLEWEPFHEQDTLSICYRDNIDNLKSHMKIYPVNAFNSRFPGNKTRSEDEFILHLMTAPKEERITTFNEFNEKL